MTTARVGLLRTIGTVAVAAAAHQAVTGVGGVRGVGHRAGRPLATTGEASVDSEVRFYAVWYGLAGVAMHKAAGDRRFDRSFSDLLAGAWAVGAFTRLLSMRAVGRPHPLFLALGGAEIAIAALLRVTAPDD